MCLSFRDGTFIILSLYDPSDLIDLNVTCVVGVLMDPAFMTLDLPMVIVIQGVSRYSRQAQCDTGSASVLHVDLVPEVILSLKVLDLKIVWES